MTQSAKVAASICVLTVLALLAAMSLVDFPAVHLRAQAPSTEIEHQLRISAQRLEDGRVQFGMRTGDAAGGWSEPVVPRVNNFEPSLQRAGRWLSSSALTLQLDSDTEQLVRSDLFRQSESDAVELVSGLSGWSEDIYYEAVTSDAGNLRTDVSMYALADGTADGELRIDLSCYRDSLTVAIEGLPRDIGDEPHIVRWSADGGPTRTERWATWSADDSTSLLPESESELVDALLSGGESLKVSLVGPVSTSATFALATLAETPVYGNLNYCEPIPQGRTEVRIQAFLHQDALTADGQARIEFALQQREPGGEWSERILPRARRIPAYGGATRWLSSTAVSVDVRLRLVAPTTTIAESDQAIVQAPIRPRVGIGWETPDIEYAAEYEPSTQGVSSHVTAHGDDGLQLTISCVAGQHAVKIAGIPSDATGEFTFTLDGRRSTVIWAVERSTGQLRPSDVGRMMQRLGSASSLFARVDASADAESSLDLINMFDTPVQPNIDHCGAYAEPVWTPVVEEQSVTTDSGVYYEHRYPEWNLERPYTGLLVTRQIRLRCAGDWGEGVLQLEIGIGDAPIPDGFHTVRSRVDEEPWNEARWYVLRRTPGNTLWISTRGSEAEELYSRLRVVSTADFEILGAPTTSVRIDVKDVFNTPVQTNFDHCAAPLWPEANEYVPLVGVDGQSSPAISYSSNVASDGVGTHVHSKSTIANDEEISFRVTCRGGRLGVVVDDLPRFDGQETDVRLRIDRVDFGVSKWSSRFSISQGHVTTSVGSRVSDRLVAQLRGASNVTIEVPAFGLPAITFDLVGLFDTPVQENIDNCGFYAPGEYREAPLPFVTSGQDTVDGATRRWFRQPTAVGSAINLHLWSAGSTQSSNVTMYLSCSENGTGITFVGAGLSAVDTDQVTFDWGIDGDSPRSEGWRATWNETSGLQFIRPTEPRALIDALSEGDTLQLHLHSDLTFVLTYDLRSLFSTPIQETVAECLNAEVQDTIAPVESSQGTTEQGIGYQAERHRGAEAVGTSVWLTVYEDATPGARRGDSRLVFSCGAAGPGIVVRGTGRFSRAFFADNTVEVTWRVGANTPKTAAWDTWEWAGQRIISPPDDAALFTALNGADTFTVSVASDPVFSETYELSANGFWDTPVQPNLDECGGS